MSDGRVVIDGDVCDEPSILMTPFLLSMGERVFVADRGMCFLEFLWATATDIFRR